MYTLLKDYVGYLIPLFPTKNQPEEPGPDFFLKCRISQDRRRPMCYGRGGGGLKAFFLGKDAKSQTVEPFGSGFLGLHDAPLFLAGCTYCPRCSAFGGVFWGVGAPEDTRGAITRWLS